jgi:hypothetical protein
MELLTNTVLKNDDIINKNASLNRNKIAWWLGLPNTSGGQYFYDLFELSHGTLTSISAGFGWKSFGRPGGYIGVRLGGNGDCISISDQSKFQVTTNDFTVSGWFYLDTLNNVNANGYQVIFSRYESGSSTGFWIGVDTSGAVILHASLSSASNSSFSSGSGAVTTNTWYHFTAIRSGIYFYLYVNGKLQASGTSAALWSLSSSSQSIYLGDMIDSSSNHHYLSGFVDDICFYNIALVSAYAFRIYEDSRTGYHNTLNKLTLSRAFYPSSPWIYYSVLQNTYGVSL